MHKRQFCDCTGASTREVSPLGRAFGIIPFNCLVIPLDWRNGPSFCGPHRAHGLTGDCHGLDSIGRRGAFTDHADGIDVHVDSLGKSWPH